MDVRADAVAFANRIRLINAKTEDRILPAIMTDGYVTLLPGESKTIGIEAPADQLTGGVKVLIKQFGKKERVGSFTINDHQTSPLAYLLQSREDLIPYEVQLSLHVA